MYARTPDLVHRTFDVTRKKLSAASDGGDDGYDGKDDGDRRTYRYSLLARAVAGDRRRP